MEDASKVNQKQKEKFLATLKQLKKDIEEIDKNTMWQTTEPNWWLKMMDIDKLTRETINSLKT